MQAHLLQITNNEVTEMEVIPGAIMVIVAIMLLLVIGAIIVRNEIEDEQTAAAAE